MTAEQWLASTTVAILVPIVIVLGLIAGVLRERDVSPDGAADSGLGRLITDDEGRPVRWTAGLALARRLTVSLLVLCVSLLFIAAVVRFAVLT